MPRALQGQESSSSLPAPSVVQIVDVEPRSEPRSEPRFRSGPTHSSRASSTTPTERTSPVRREASIHLPTRLQDEPGRAAERERFNRMFITDAPTQLPAPLVPTEHSVSSSFGMGDGDLPPELRFDNDKLVQVFNSHPELPRVHAPVAHVPAVVPLPPQPQSTMQRLKELGSASLTRAATISTGPMSRPPMLLSQPVGFGGPIDVPNPTTLRTLMRQPSANDFDDSVGPALRVRLSGVGVQQVGTQWSLLPGQQCHDAVPPANERLETVALPPSLVALYDHGQRRWTVVPQALLQRERGVAPTADAPGARMVVERPAAPERRFVVSAIRAAEGIIDYHRLDAAFWVGLFLCHYLFERLLSMYCSLRPRRLRVAR